MENNKTIATNNFPQQLLQKLNPQIQHKTGHKNPKRKTISSGPHSLTTAQK
jgi:hypothetical protein